HGGRQPAAAPDSFRNAPPTGDTAPPRSGCPHGVHTVRRPPRGPAGGGRARRRRGRPGPTVRTATRRARQRRDAGRGPGDRTPAGDGGRRTRLSGPGTA